jgi:hypothetical protein
LLPRYRGDTDTEALRADVLAGRAAENIAPASLANPVGKRGYCGSWGCRVMNNREDEEEARAARLDGWIIWEAEKREPPM